MTTNQELEEEEQGFDVNKEHHVKLQIARMFHIYLLFLNCSAPAVFFDQGAERIGGKYWKALYVEYTDHNFTKRKDKAEHLGFLGPIIRAEVGDTIEVVFKNNVIIPFSFYHCYS